MNTCPTVKEVTMPGCYSGVLKVNTGLEPGTPINWKIRRDGGIYGAHGSVTVEPDGNITLLGAILSYFNTYTLSFKASDFSDLNIKGYDCYRLLPVKNANEVVDVII